MALNIIVNISSIAFILLLAFLGFLKGRKKGGTKSLLAFVLLIVNIIVSVPLSRWIADLVVTPNTLKGILTKVNGGESEGFLAEILPYFDEGEFLATADMSLVFALFEVILTPIIYIATFFVAGIILWIIKLIIIKLFVPEPEEGVTLRRSSKIVGGCLVAVKRVLTFVVFLAPIIGFANYGVNTVHTANNVMGGTELVDLDEQVSEYETIVTSGTFGVINNCGGRWLFSMLSSKNVGQVRVSLVEETENALNIYGKINPLTKIDSADFTTKEADLLDEAINEIDNSEYLTAMLASVMSQASKELIEQDEVIGYKRPIFGESFDPVVDEFLRVWSTTDRAGLVKDLRTYSAVFRSTIEQGLYKEMKGDIFVVLEKSEFYAGIFQNLNYNTRTKRIAPVLANALQNYLYEVYEEINGVPYPTYPNDVDESKINEASLNAESVRIATAIKELRYFSSTTNGIEYVEDIVKQGDFVALGTGLNNLRDSIFVGNSYEFLLVSILESEACAKLGIFDKNFVNSALGNDRNDPSDDADMVELLLSRQNLATLTMAMWDGDKQQQEDSLKVLITNLSKENTEGEAEALKELATLENLDKYGVRGDKGNTVSSITTSLVDTINAHEYKDKNGDGVVDQADIDIEATEIAHILTVMSGAHNSANGVTDVFGTGEGESKTGESADQFVSNVLASEIAKEMMDSAVKEDATGDPYGIHGTLSDADKASVESALANEYANNSENKKALENLAAILGVDFNK